MRTTKIGLLVAIALAILMVTVFSLNQEQPFWERKVQYEVRFTRTGGLQTGAPVSLSGDIVTNTVEVTASLKDVLGAIQRGEGLLGAMLRNRELGETTLVDLQRTMANVQATTASLEKILQRVDRGEGMLGQLTSDTKEARELLG